MKPRRNTKIHFVSERLFYHLIESKVLPDTVRRSNRTYCNRYYGFKTLRVDTIPEFLRILGLSSEDNKWLERRYGRNARSFVSDTVGTMGNQPAAGGSIHIALCMVRSDMGHGGRFIEQSRMRISFVHDADGVEDSMHETPAAIAQHHE